MRNFEVSVPEVAFVAATRGMAGAGVGLLVSDLIPAQHRRTVGWTLIAIGLITTVPILATAIARARWPRLLAD